MMGYLKGQKQLSLLKYSWKNQTTIPVTGNILLSKRLKGDHNQLFKSF
jgi:hypothetical protein